MKTAVALLAMVCMMFLLVGIVSAQEAPIKPGQAFSFQYGIIIPGPTPIQLTGGDAPGNVSPKPGQAFGFTYGIFIPMIGTPIQMQGGDQPGVGYGDKKPAKAFGFTYGIFMPGPGCPIQLQGGDAPGTGVGDKK